MPEDMQRPNTAMMPPYKHQLPSKPSTLIDKDTYMIENTFTLSLDETLCRLRRNQELEFSDLVSLAYPPISYGN